MDLTESLILGVLTDCMILSFEFIKNQKDERLDAIVVNVPIPTKRFVYAFESFLESLIYIPLIISIKIVTACSGSFSPKNPDAKFFPEISYQEAVDRGLKVMDTAAFQLCKDQKIPQIRIFNMDDLENIIRVAQDQPIGTVVHA